MPDEKLPLILHPGSGLALVGPQGGRIVAEMVSGALALSRPVAAATQISTPTPPFRIGNQEWCEPDYRQILQWAKALDMEPVKFVEVLFIELPAEEEFDYLLDEPHTWHKSNKIVNGRIVELVWNLELLPMNSFEWVDGLVIEGLTFSSPEEPAQPERNLSLPLPELRRLECRRTGLVNLDVSKVRKLTLLSCDENQLTSLVHLAVMSRKARYINLVAASSLGK